MTDEILPETQWTTAARDAYVARGEELLGVLRDHIALTLSRAGRQAEYADYTPSAARLHEVVAAFDEAEFDWCGTFPLGLDADRWEDGDEDDEDEVSADADILSVFGRWDHRVTNQSAVIDAGRAAYSRVWEDDTVDDASIAVADLAGAAREIAHADGWGSLDAIVGLESVALQRA